LLVSLEAAALVIHDMLGKSSMYSVTSDCFREAVDARPFDRIVDAFGPDEFQLITIVERNVHGDARRQHVPGSSPRPRPRRSCLEEPSRSSHDWADVKYLWAHFVIARIPV
jgi:hypothetical protein